LRKCNDLLEALQHYDGTARPCQRGLLSRRCSHRGKTNDARAEKASSVEGQWAVAERTLDF